MRHIEFDGTNVVISHIERIHFDTHGPWTVPTDWKPYWMGEFNIPFSVEMAGTNVLKLCDPCKETVDKQFWRGTKSWLGNHYKNFSWVTFEELKVRPSWELRLTLSSGTILQERGTYISMQNLRDYILNLIEQEKGVVI